LYTSCHPKEVAVRPAHTLLSASLALALARPALAAPPSTDAFLDETRARWEELARKVWSFHEVALEEKQSAAVLADVLEKEGFKVTRGVAGMPTAFVASAGSGAPVIGILAEYDALPGLSQAPGQPTRQPEKAGAAGHGCGHNLLGSAAVAAGIAAHRELAARKLPGTIRVFGTPAEELLLGKVFMARDGAFQGTDALLAWHPDDENRVPNRTRLAISAIDVEFHGRTAHAAAAPWLGRSALDAVELFDHALALMREHVLPTARMHRAIKAGGDVPNVIPDYAKVQWFVRDADVKRVEEMLGRVRKAADGAALGTETAAKVTLLGQTREPVPNDTLGQVLQRELERVGPPRFDEREVAYAKELQRSMGVAEKGLSSQVVPYGPGHGSTASSDIGEASAIVPLAELNVVTRPLGTASHTWVVTSCSAHPLGGKGMLVAAKVLAASAVRLAAEPPLVSAAKDELAKATGGRPYQSPLSADARPARY
jgi:aminobenzoyl-glutamate utilization protein B